MDGLRVMAVAVVLHLALAATGAGSEPTRPPATPAVADATVESLSWLVGSWHGGADGVAFDEIWAAPAGGEMVGLWRLVRAGRVALYELFTIARDERGVVLRLRHFDPLLEPWAAERAGALTLRLVEHSEGHATFAGEAGDREVRLVYRLVEGGVLEVGLVEPGGGATFSYRRQR